jgi:hypothetical protein
MDLGRSEMDLGRRRRNDRSIGCPQVIALDYFFDDADVRRSLFLEFRSRCAFPELSTQSSVFIYARPTSPIVRGGPTERSVVTRRRQIPAHKYYGASGNVPEHGYRTAAFKRAGIERARGESGRGRLFITVCIP